MPEQTCHPDAGPTTELANIPRKNFKNGQFEQFRIYTNTFKGKHLLHARIWYQNARPQTEDGWRPSEAGVSFRETDLDALLEALQSVRKQVHDEGRATCPPAPGERNPRGPSASERRRQANDPGQSVAAQSRAYRAELDKGGPAPAMPSGGNGQVDAFDELAPYRKNAK